MKKAFTLVELLVVIAMIAILSGSIGTAVNGARKRARLSRAQIEAQELTKAILAYANYTDDGTLSSVPAMNEAPATISNLKFIMGQVTQRGATVPVLYNASTAKDGSFIDPWGHPYRVTIKRGENIRPPGVPAMDIGVFYPNWHRLGEGERQ